MFFKIDALKKVSETSQESTWVGISFSKTCRLKVCNFIKIRLQRRCISVNFAKFLRTPFLQNPSDDCFFTSGGSFCTFLKKQLNSYFATLLCRNYNFFFSTHRFMHKKSNLFVYKFVTNCQVFEITPSEGILWSWKLAWSHWSLITWTIIFETPFFRYLSMCL